MKIAIIGFSGAGKSTLAQKLGHIYHCPILHLDQIHFLPGWIDRDAATANAMVAQFMENTDWVIDGNYAKYAFDRRMREADRIILLDFPRRICLWRVLLRYSQNKNTVRNSAAPGCAEKIDVEFIRWVLIGGRGKNMRERHRALAKTYRDKFIRCQSQRDVDRLLASTVAEAQYV